MNIDKKIIDRLNQLLDSSKRLLVAKPGDWQIDKQFANQWGVSCLNLLKRVFGEESDHYRLFYQNFVQLNGFPLTSVAETAIGILQGAKDDYEHGFIFDKRRLIEAELFDDFLEMAAHLLEQGYYGPAAVVAGAVLEDGLRKLCHKNSVPLGAKPKLDSMNSDLTKANVYTVLVQKKITFLADLRNKAAHGKWTEFGPTDVDNMVRDVRNFMTTYLA